MIKHNTLLCRQFNIMLLSNFPILFCIVNIILIKMPTGLFDKFCYQRVSISVQ